MYGTLTLITGCMFAGKTTELLRRVLWARNGEKRATLVIKPSFDTRYSEVEIKTHDGLGVEAHSVGSVQDVRDLIDRYGLDALFIDEAQFFEGEHFEGDFVEFVRSLLASNVTVVANGLDMTCYGDAFPVTAQLAAMADEVIKKTAYCTECGRPAAKTFRKSGEGGAVMLGADDLYEARCNDHWEP